MLARDNLRIKTMAKYKSIKAGEVFLYQEIENQLVDLALRKGKAFEDSSMEEKERAISTIREDPAAIIPLRSSRKLSEY